jgi:hypothetical protein
MYAARGKLGLGEQLAFMKLWWPGFATVVRRGRLRSEGDLVPSALSATYRVQITLPGGGLPEVRVLSPKLEERGDGELIPHMYGQERLCLCLPGQWTGEKPIAMTVVPWTSVWLYFYEVWRATGEWLGGGVEPGDDVDNDGKD